MSDPEEYTIDAERAREAPNNATLWSLFMEQMLINRSILIVTMTTDPKERMKMLAVAKKEIDDLSGKVMNLIGAAPK